MPKTKLILEVQSNINVPNTGTRFNINGDILEYANRGSNTFQPLKLLGFNDNLGDWSHSFGTPWQSTTNLDNPLANRLMAKIVGNSKPENVAINPLKVNCIRTYVPTQDYAKIESAAEQSGYATSGGEKYENNCLFFANLLDQNITVTSIPALTISWGTVPVGDQGNYQVFVMNANNELANSGKVAGIRVLDKAGRNISPLLLSGITVQISGGGLGAAVTIPPAKLFVRKRSIYAPPVVQSIGAGYKYNGVNKGFATYNVVKTQYYYSTFDGSNKETGDTLEPVILARLRHHNVMIPPSGTIPSGSGVYDYYSTQTYNFGQLSNNGILDTWLIDGGEYMPDVNGETNKVRYGIYDASNKWLQWLIGASYDFNYDGFKALDNLAKTSQQVVKTYSNDDIMAYYRNCKKYEIFPIFNFFFQFAPYNSGAFTGSQDERKRQAIYYRSEFKTAVFRQLEKIANVTDTYQKEGDEILIALGNESNLDYMLKGYDYSIGSPTYGQEIYFANIANPTNRQANVTAMIAFYNEIARDIKEYWGSKFKVGVVLQYGSTGQATEIETAFAAGAFSQLDWLGNNYYGNYSVANPEKNGENVDLFLRYKTNVSNANRIPMIITECGSPHTLYFAPNALVPGNETLYDVLPGTVITYNNTTEQSQLMTNLSNTILNNVAYSHVAGVVWFPFYNQPSRDKEYLYTEYDSFRFPKPLVIAGQPSYTPAGYKTYFNEKDMSIFDYPIKDIVNLNNDYGNIPNTTAGIISKYRASVTTIRSTITTNHPLIPRNI
jgi:hypothetical protein